MEALGLTELLDIVPPEEVTEPLLMVFAGSSVGGPVLGSKYWRNRLIE